MAVAGGVEQGVDTVNMPDVLAVSLYELGVMYEGVLPGLLG